MPTLEYTTDEDLEVRANRQHFRALVGRRWLGIVACFATGTAVLFWRGSSLLVYTGFFAIGAGVCLTILWIATYLHLVGAARKHFRRMRDHRIHVQYDDEGFEWSSDLGSNRTRWNDVTRHVETRDFHILYTDRLPVAAVPKRLLEPETRSFLLSKVPLGTRSSRAR